MTFKAPLGDVRGQILGVSNLLRNLKPQVLSNNWLNRLNLCEPFCLAYFLIIVPCRVPQSTHSWGTRPDTYFSLLSSAQTTSEEGQGEVAMLEGVFPLEERRRKLPPRA